MSLSAKPAFPLKPTHKPIKDYYAALAQFHLHGHTTEDNTRADGALVDDLTLVHGIWEAKDSDDDLEKEITAKRNKGYPLTNILFQSPTHAVLYQDNLEVFNDERNGMFSRRSNTADIHCE